MGTGPSLDSVGSSSSCQDQELQSHSAPSCRSLSEEATRCSVALLTSEHSPTPAPSVSREISEESVQPTSRVYTSSTEGPGEGVPCSSALYISTGSAEDVGNPSRWSLWCGCVPGRCPWKAPSASYPRPRPHSWTGDPPRIYQPLTKVPESIRLTKLTPHTPDASLQPHVVTSERYLPLLAMKTDFRCFLRYVFRK